MHQGYLTQAPPAESSIRVRIEGEVARLNIKAAVVGTTRAEYEYQIPLDDGLNILRTLCAGRVVEKTRYRIPADPHVWEVDVFEGANAGLVVAEIELSAEDESFDQPEWLGEEVTQDIRYYNNQLASQPYASW